MENSRYLLYYVGGYVRDKILQIESKDIDFTFVINLKPNEKLTIIEGFCLMEEWLIQEGFTIFLSTPSMLTIRAKFPKNNKYHNNSNMCADFVLARKEVYLDEKSRIPIVEIGTLQDDLMRRDFTVNALALDMNGNIIDICNGLNDIEKKILRTPNSSLKTLEEDPLRVLRAMRFHITKQFDFDKELLYAMFNENIFNKLLKTVSKDRIREELNKMFMFSTPQTLKLLYYFDNNIPNFIDKLFEDSFKLIPTSKIKIKLR